MRQGGKEGGEEARELREGGDEQANQGDGPRRSNESTEGGGKKRWGRDRR